MTISIKSKDKMYKLNGIYHRGDYYLVVDPKHELVDRFMTDGSPVEITEHGNKSIRYCEIVDKQSRVVNIYQHIKEQTGFTSDSIKDLVGFRFFTDYDVSDHLNYK